MASGRTNWQLRQRTPSPETDLLERTEQSRTRRSSSSSTRSAAASSSSKPSELPRPDASLPRGSIGGNTVTVTVTRPASRGADSTPARASSSSSKAASFAGLSRAPSRTQLRHANAARRFSDEAPGPAIENNCEGGGEEPESGSGSDNAPAVITGRGKDGPADAGANENYSHTNDSTRAGPSSHSSPALASGSQGSQSNGHHEFPSQSDSNSSSVTSGSNLSDTPSRTFPKRPKLKRSSGTSSSSDIFYALARGERPSPSLSSATRPSAADQEYYRALAASAEARSEAQRINAATSNGRPMPLLSETLECAKVDLMADTTNLTTVYMAQPILKATYMTPCTVLDMLHFKDNYYHLWVAVEETLKRLPEEARLRNPDHMDIAVQIAMPKFIAELSYAVSDCGTHTEYPHYTFLDPRIYDLPDMNDVISVAVDQACTIASILLEKDVKKERIYFNIPANEAGLRVAHALRHAAGLKSNLVFVSTLLQARACATLGVDSITIPVRKVVKREQGTNPFYHVGAKPTSFELIQAIACYMKKHAAFTKVLGTELTELPDIKYLACLDGIVLRGSEIERAKMMTLRVNRPLKENSPAMKRAENAKPPFDSNASVLASEPKSCTTASDTNIETNGTGNKRMEQPAVNTEDPFLFLDHMSSSSKKETLSILLECLSPWKSAMNTIEDRLRAEFDKRCFITHERERGGDPHGLKRSDTEPLEEEYLGELLGEQPLLSAAREEPPRRHSGKTKSRGGLRRESSRRECGSSSVKKHRRTLARANTAIDIPFPSDTVNDDTFMDREGPMPSEEMLLQSPIMRSRDDFNFDSDSDSDNEENFLV